MPKVASSLRPKWTTLSDQAFAEAVQELGSPTELAAFWGLPVTQLNYHAYHAPAEREYRRLSIPRRNGRTRELQIPNRSLKYIQRIIHETLIKIYRPRRVVHGFVSGKSIITNAKSHLGQRYVLNIDLENFFPSITRARIIARLKAAPYNLQPPVATLIGFTATDGQGRLPQGSPCSPVISNIIAAKMDSDLVRLTSAFKCIYTRYADDITISTNREEFPPDIARYPTTLGTVQVVVGEALMDVIEENHFSINQKKCRLQNSSTRQMCTGLVVNGEKVGLPGPYKRRLRALIHNWKIHGWEAAAQTMHEKERRPLMQDRERLRQHVLGRINYVKMVRGQDHAGAAKFLRAVLEIPPGH